MQSALIASLVRHRLWWALACVVLVAGAALGARSLWFESSYKIFFSKDDPRLLAYEQMEAAYTRADNAAFVLAPRNGDLFTRENLAAIEWLTDQGWQLPRSIRVDSVTNFQYSRAHGDELVVSSLVEDAMSLSDEQLAEVRRVALSEPLLVHSLVSGKGHVGSVNVRFELPEEAHAQSDAIFDVMDAVHALRDAFVARYPQFDVHLMGQVVVNHAFNDAAARDVRTLVPVMFAAVIVLLWLFLRSLWGTLATVLIIIGSIAITVGATGWLGYRLNQVNISAPIIILTLAVSDCVHILVTYLKSLGRGSGRVEAMQESLRVNLVPVVLTSVTTAIGFFSLNFSDSPPFREMGNSVGIGVLGAMVLSLALLPALMLLVPEKGRVAAPGGRPSPFGALADWIVARQRVLFWGVLALALACIACIPRNEFNDDTVEYFDRSLPIRQAFDFVEEHLTGVDSISYSLPAGGPDGIYDPEYLRQVEAFANWYASQPEVTHVSTFTDVVKRLNRNMHGDDPAWYRLPEDRELIAQYVLLYELSLPMGLDLANQVTFDKSATKLTVQLHNMNSRQIIAMEERAQAWLAEHAPRIATPGASVSLMFAHVGQNNIESMMEGSAVALALIGLTLMLVLRSVKFGLLSLLPNAFPAAISFGLWGLISGKVNLAVAAVFSITLGIVVDNTVHFFSKYLYARRQRGLDVPGAIHYAFETVGAALAVTTVALTLGFSILAQSTFAVNGSMGTMTAMTIAIALVFDLLFLPGLLLRAEREPARA